MNENQTKPSDLIDTTDCLEAIGVFRGWKNTLFIIVILCLLLLQSVFWLVNTGYVKTDDDTKSGSPAVVARDTEKTEQMTEPAAGRKDEISKAAEQVVAAPNQPTTATPQQQQPQSQRTPSLFSYIKFKHLSRLIRFFNFVLIIAAMLYCLTMLFALKVSLLGRLGGINHIARAFFLSLLVLVLLLPWQRFFAGVAFGAIYTPGELSTSCADETRGVFGTAFHYWRFTGHWLLAVLLLIFSQFRSARWAKAILRRLEVI